MSNFANIQLSKVMKADLSNYDPNTNRYIIPKINEIKLEINKTYLIHLSNIKLPYDGEDIIADISNIDNGEVKVNAVGYNNITKQIDYSFNWSGKLFIKDIQVLEKF